MEKECLKLISISYKELNQTGRAVNQARYDNVLGLHVNQGALGQELVEKTNFKALQSALGLSIELDNKIKENRKNKKGGY